MEMYAAFSLWIRYVGCQGVKNWSVIVSLWDPRIRDFVHNPSGKHTKNDGTSPSFIGKSTIYIYIWAILNSNVITRGIQGTILQLGLGRLRKISLGKFIIKQKWWTFKTWGSELIGDSTKKIWGFKQPNW